MMTVRATPGVRRPAGWPGRLADGLMWLALVRGAVRGVVLGGGGAKRDLGPPPLQADLTTPKEGRS